MRRLSWDLALAALSLAGIVRIGAAQETIADPRVVAIPKFVDVTGSAGIDSVYKGEWQYMVGEGVAVFDCGGDGFPDIFLAGGEAPAKFYRNMSKRGGPLRFELQTSGLELDRVIGAYPVDIDGDGITDLVLLRVGGNVVMRGVGRCKFERANERSTAATPGRPPLPRPGTWLEWPTIAIGNYIDRREEIAPWGTCTDNWLFRPNVIDGNPERKFGPPLALKPSFRPLSMLFSDWAGPDAEPQGRRRPRVLRRRPRAVVADRARQGPCSL